VVFEGQSVDEGVDDFILLEVGALLDQGGVGLADLVDFFLVVPDEVEETVDSFFVVGLVVVASPEYHYVAIGCVEAESVAVDFLLEGQCWYIFGLFGGILIYGFAGDAYFLPLR